MEIKYINPASMVKPRGYSHAVSVAGNCRTIYIGGQNALDENGILVGKNNLKQQTEHVLSNIEKIVKDAGSKLEHIVKFTIHLLHGQNPQDGFRAFQERWKDTTNFPTVTVVFVAGLGNPDWLVEIDAIAVVPSE
jgi:enamine deaminase RidA (YjgF/YER057c/UK114 family)